MTGTITEKAISEEQGGGDDVADVDVGNGAEEESAVARLGQSFGELTEELLEVGFNIWQGPFAGGMPGTLEIADTFTMSLMRIDQRLAFVRDELGRTRFDFDWVADDYRAGQRAALGELKEVEETLDGIRTALLRWLGTVHSNSTRIIEVSRDAWPLLHELASLSPLHHSGEATGSLVEIAVEYLAASGDARRIVADAEARRSAKRRGLAGVVNDGGGTSSGSAKAEQVSGLADSADRQAEDDSADEDSADEDFVFPGKGEYGWRLQIWDSNEPEMRCVLDLPVLFSDPGPAAERRVVSRVAQIAAEESRRYAEGIAQTVARMLDRTRDNSGPAEAGSARAKPHEQLAKAG